MVYPTDTNRANRYLHLGLISHGCVTVRPFIPRNGDPYLEGRWDSEIGFSIPNPSEAVAKWTDLYQYLINQRKGDNR